MGILSLLSGSCKKLLNKCSSYINCNYSHQDILVSECTIDQTRMQYKILMKSAFFNNRSEKDQRLQNGNVLTLSWRHYEGKVRNELINSKVTMGGIYMESDWGENWNPLFVSWSHTL